MFDRTFSDFKEWLDEEGVEYLATPDNDIILNFKDMRVEHIDGDEVRVYLDKDKRYKIFELDSTDFLEIKIF